MPARGSPWLFAACHVLHRLLVPRHPPNALIALEIDDTSVALATNAPSPPYTACNRRNFPPRLEPRKCHSAPQAAMTGHSLSTKHIASERICPVARFTPYGDSPVRQTATEARPETHQNLIHPDKDRHLSRPRAGQTQRRHEDLARRTVFFSAVQTTTWWRRSGSNRRPPACKAGALPAELRPLRKSWALPRPARGQLAP
jgi:hypothetical protein